MPFTALFGTWLEHSFNNTEPKKLLVLEETKFLHWLKLKGRSLLASGQVVSSAYSKSFKAKL